MSYFLDTVFFNNTVRRWLISLAFIFGGFIAGKIISLVMRLILNLTHKHKKGNADGAVIKTFEKPLALLVFLLGLVIGLKGLDLNETVREWIGKALNSFLIIIISWALTRAVDALLVRLIPHTGKDHHGKREIRLQPVLRKFFDFIIWLIAIILILKTIGYNVSALMAGLGLGGAALALASKDTLANFFGSITVFFDKPFRMNDRIKIGDYDGVITEMGFRTSRLKTQENRTVFIPNSLFAAQPIENISVQPSVRVVQTINFKGDNGSEKIERGLQIIRDIAAGDPGLEGKAVVGLTSVGGLICHVNFIYFISKKADYSEIVNRVNMEILRRFEEAEIRLG
ncbi:MAG: mechanosensitive ion channel family protein [Treponema sp.]|nr:mechanosensitive ion channel family protein [Treponema sp.]